jgi:hypothetical protein
VLDNTQKKAFYQESAYLLKFSGVLFDSFGEVGDRVIFFRFLGIVLAVAVQNKGIVPVRALRDFEGTERMLNSLKARTKEYLFQGLIEGFGNTEGAFFDMPPNQNADRALKLNAHFYRAAANYLELFAVRLSDGRLDWEVSAARPGEILIRLHTAIAFQQKRHYEEWKRFIGQLALKGQNHNYPENVIKEELMAHAPYWSILLTVWRHYLGDPDQNLSVSLKGLARATSDAMRDVDPRELLSCLSFLSHPDGTKIFEKTKGGGRELYLLNAEHEPSFVAYSQAMIKLHPELIEQLQQQEIVR